METNFESSTTGGVSAELLTTTSGVARAKSLVNPVALRQCTVRSGDAVASILDISFVRLVFEQVPTWPEMDEKNPLTMAFELDRHVFNATLSLLVRGEGWFRCAFSKIVPSSQAHLRAFLSPKKVGESIVEDWRTDEMRHYHGLNESELWFHSNGSVIFTYLDSYDGNTQFMIRLINDSSVLHVGRVTRKDYMEMNSLEAEVPLVPLSDREVYSKLSECRDIVTNFRPIGQTEYNLKQRLLKIVSESLYSTSRRVDFSPVRPPKIVTLEG